MVDGSTSGLLTSNLAFELSEGIPGLQVATAGFAGPFPGAPYAGAEPVVLSTAVDDLRGIARVEFVAMAGDTLFLEANVIGTVGPRGSASNAQFSSAQLDVLDTGVLRLELPPGVTLSGASGALASATVVVPEPIGAASLFVGCTTLVVIGRRSRRRAGRSMV